MRIFGHRGYSMRYPENTRQSFQSAIKLGADGGEIDVRRALNKVVVLHDATLKRTAVGWLDSAGNQDAFQKILDQPVAGLDEETLRGVNVGTAESPEPVPFLVEVLEDFCALQQQQGRELGLLVEVKGEDLTVVKPLKEAMRQLASRYSVQELAGIRFIGFDRELMLALKAGLPAFDHFMIGEESDSHPEFIAQAKADGFRGVDLEVSPRVTPQLVAEAHDKGLEVITWVSREKGTDGLEWAEKMQDSGVDIMTSDLPESLHHLLIRP